MHADEAILADKFGTLLETGKFTYDPSDYHGPVLPYATLPAAWLRGQHRYLDLDETTLRIVPALAGVALSLAPLALAGSIGPVAAVCAGVMIAVSPVCVYYSRYYISEMPLALLTAILLIVVERLRASSNWMAWAAAGLIAGLAFATKETAVLAIASQSVAAWIVWRPRPTLREVIFLAAGFLIPVIWMHPELVLQSIPSYFSRGMNAGPHNHPWYYYGQLLIGWGTSSRETAILAFGFAGFFVRTDRPFARFLKMYCLTLAVLYCAIPYKTPWCVVSIVFALALLGGIAFQSLPNRKAAVAIMAALSLYLAWQAARISGPDATSALNQWAYAQSGGDVVAIRDRAAQIAKKAGPSIRIGVWTVTNPWPLPWYFRSFPNTGWARGIPAGAPPDVIVTSPSLMPTIERKIYEDPPPGERELFIEAFDRPIELRPGEPVRVLVRRSVAERFR